MLHHAASTVRVIWACMKKDIKSALTERIATVIGVILPVNFLILMSLFVLSGGQAPTAVVMQDSGPYAQQFYDAMAHAHSFILQKKSAQEAEALIQEGRIVTTVTIPPDFDTRIQRNEPMLLAADTDRFDLRGNRSRLPQRSPDPARGGLAPRMWMLFLGARRQVRKQLIFLARRRQHLAIPRIDHQNFRRLRTAIDANDEISHE